MDDVSSVTAGPAVLAAEPHVAAMPGSPASSDNSAANVKETLEQILVAFVLAFIFRAFIVEAFVIPTGSMAPTLLGAHMRYRCPDCGYRFDVNYSPPGHGDDPDIPSAAGPVQEVEEETINGQKFRRVTLRHVDATVFCPNCGYKIDLTNPANDPEDTARDAQIFYGDRILVLKYLYLFQQPTRWDVVVFKSPDDAAREYQTNYIKRLVGKPGETVMVLDGDVYIANTPSPTLADFTVQTKPRYAQEALWRIAYDNDFHPLGRERADGSTWLQPWHTETADGQGWNLGTNQSTRRVFTFDNLAGAATLRFDDSNCAQRGSLTNWLGYDSDYWAQSHPLAHNVSDLKLSVYYQRQQGQGPFNLELTKRDYQFTATVLPDRAQLWMSHNGLPPTSVGEVPLAASNRARHVELSNVDYQVTLRLDDVDVIHTTPQQYHPDLAALMTEFNKDLTPPAPVVRIEAQQQRCELSHIALWHDVYYLNDGGVFWASPRKFPQRLARLGKDEYFVLGDNSLISGDARYWHNYPIDLPAENLQADTGRVPGRFMLGKAFFVYWPAGFRPVAGAPALVPNFGDMRFIH